MSGKLPTNESVANSLTSIFQVELSLGETDSSKIVDISLKIFQTLIDHSKSLPEHQHLIDSMMLPEYEYEEILQYVIENPEQQTNLFKYVSGELVVPEKLKRLSEETPSQKPKLRLVQ